MSQLEQAFNRVQPVVQQTPVAPVPIQQQSSSLERPQETLLAFYDEFANTDDGKALAASLNKFSRFVQSKVNK